MLPSALWIKECVI